jgi:hypothetical protein
MKASLPFRPQLRKRRNAAAFTIPEFLITSTIVVFIMGAVIACHLVGLRMFEMTKAKLGASDDARRAISSMITEIRSAKIVRVGEGDVNAFKEIGLNTPHIGSAIQVYPSTDTNVWIRYFWDGSDQKLKRATNGSVTPTLIASAVSNQMVFSAEDYTGTPLINNAQDYVIGLNLQFFQLQYPRVSIGPGNYYDYYQLQTRITPRAP